MSTASPSPPGDLTERLAAIATRAQAARIPSQVAELPERLKLGLMLLPCFTVRTLQALGADAISTTGTLRELAGRGLVEADPGALDPEATMGSIPGRTHPGAIRISNALRAELTEHFLQSTATEDAVSRRKRLRRDCAVLAETLRHADGPLPDAVALWIDLARHAENGTAMASELDKRVEAAVERRASGDALSWIEVARPLAALLERDTDRSMSVALERAGRQLELLMRDRADWRHLETFLERPEQVDPLTRFIEGPPDRWQLHLLGPGGVGKTMLLRHLTLRMAKIHGFVPARIDFDYLNPDYPRLDPGLLLWAIGRELRLRDEGELATKRLNDVDFVFQRLRDRLRSAGGDESPTARPELADAIVLFIDALRVLPREESPRPVLIVLDTCEELVKARSRSGGADAVAETFRILGALKHGAQFLVDGRPAGYGLSSLRVVFAGRRPLASSGAGWSAHTDLPSRPGLEVVELRGFNPHEAETWLRERLQVPASLVPAVIAGTPRVHPGIRVERDGQRGPLDPGLNPYDIEHLADWARETPPPTPEVLASGSSTQYVDFRVLRRLDDPRLEAYLPAIALLRYFDRDLLMTAVEPDEATAALFDRLVDYDWIERRVVATPEIAEPRVVYGVDERLRRRLWQHYVERGVDVHELAARAADHLKERTLNRPLEHLDQADFEAAVRAFTFDVDGGRTWWRRAVHRIAGTRGFDWLAQVTAFLLGDDQVAGPPQPGPLGVPHHPMRPDILAVSACAFLHTGAYSRAASEWEEVAAAVSGRSDDHARELNSRATLGRLVATPPRTASELAQAAHTWDAEWRAWARREPSMDLSSAFVAAIDVIVEQGEELEQAGERPWASLDEPDWAPVRTHQLATSVASATLRTWRFSTSVAGASGEQMRWEIAGYSRCLAVRAAALWGGPPADEFDSLHRTLEAWGALQTSADSRVSPWLDWAPPPSLMQRIRLEVARVQPDPAIAIEWLALRPAHFTTPSAELDRSWALHLDVLARDRLTGLIAGATDEELLSRLSQWPLVPARNDNSRQPIAHRTIRPAALVAARLLVERGQHTRGLQVFEDVARRSHAIDTHVNLHAQRLYASLMVRLRLPPRELPALEQSDDPSDQWLPAYAEFVCAPPSGRAMAKTKLDRLERWAHSQVSARDPIQLMARTVWRERINQWENPEGITRVNGLGPRGQAWVAWQIGDLLAFVEPERAEQYLGVARRLFAASEDAGGEFIALARRALMIASPARAFSSQDVQRRLAEALRDCEVCYGQLPLAGDSRLPPWSATELTDIRSLGTRWPESLGEWAPWLVRLALCRYCLRTWREDRNPFDDSEMLHLRQILIEQADIALLTRTNPDFDNPVAEPPPGAAGGPFDVEGGDQERRERRREQERRAQERREQERSAEERKQRREEEKHVARVALEQARYDLERRSDTTVLREAARSAGEPSPAVERQVRMASPSAAPLAARKSWLLPASAVAVILAFIVVGFGVFRLRPGAPAPGDSSSQSSTASPAPTPTPSAPSNVEPRGTDTSTAPPPSSDSAASASPPLAAPPPVSQPPPATSKPSDSKPPAPQSETPPAPSTNPPSSLPPSPGSTPTVPSELEPFPMTSTSGSEEGVPGMLSSRLFLTILGTMTIALIVAGVRRWRIHHTTLLLTVHRDPPGEAGSVRRWHWELCRMINRLNGRWRSRTGPMRFTAEPRSRTLLDKDTHDGMLPRDLAGKLRTYAPAARRKGLEIRLVLGTDDARRIAWDSIFARAMSVPPDRVRLAISLDVSARSGTRAFRALPPRAIVLTQHRGGGQLALDAWKTVHDAAEMRHSFDELAVPQEGPAPIPGFDVLHLVGDVVGYDKDVRIQLGAGTDAATGHVDPATVQRIAGDIPLVVVQAAIRGARATPRQVSDQRDAANLREFAAQVHATGGPDVLVVPPMSAAAAAEVLAELAPLGRAERYDGRLLLDLVSRMRRRILGVKEGTADEATELAGDLCVFARTPDHIRADRITEVGR